MPSQLTYWCSYAAAIAAAAVVAFFSAFSDHMSPLTKVLEFVLCAGVVLVSEMSLRALHDHCEWNLRIANRFLLAILGAAGALFSFYEL